MLLNHLKIAWRNLLKNKVFSFINIFGLSVGLAACLLLTLYIKDEMTYDKHHKDASRIYRVATQVKTNQWAATPAPLSEAMQRDLPEVEQATRVLKFPNVDNLLLTDIKSNKKLYETLGFYVDSTYFEIFTHEFKYGNISTALNKPNSVVLSEDTATKLFGDINPVNEVINIEIPYGNENYTVTGVYKANDGKSHIETNLLISMKNDGLGSWVEQQTSWSSNNLFHTYFKLKKDIALEPFTVKLQRFFQENGAKDLQDANIEKTVFVQPMQDIYLKSDIGNEISSNGSMTYIYIFGSIAAFLLLIACINFMNLSTARSEKRAMEVGMRKVLGANKNSLVLQFLGEALLMCFFSLLLSLLLILLALPLFNEFTQKSLSLFQSPEIVLWIIGLALATGLLSGFYPAFYLSSFKPITVLKGTLANSFSAKAIRKGLVVFQFVISVSLILVSFIIWQQMDFIKNQDLGFKKDQQIIFPFRNVSTVKNYEILKSEILKNPNILAATAGTTYPGFELVQDNSFYAEEKTIDDQVWIRFAMGYENYISTLGYEIIFGKDLPLINDPDMEAIVLNETAIRDLGYEVSEEVIGKRIYWDGDEKKHALEIVGVVKDFHYQNLHETISPYGIRKLTQGQPSYFIASMTDANVKNSISSLENIWKDVNPRTPFEYSFLNDDFQKNYQKEEITSQVVFSFMFIAIFIACIGLFGLASFTTEQRKKEVGIRRVLGASVLGITAMQIKDFLKLVLIALVLATPLSLYLGTQWLQDFAYRIDISWHLFAIAGLSTIVIALITVGSHVVKAAMANPINNLRTE